MGPCFLSQAPSPATIPWPHSQVLQVGQARKCIVLNHREGVGCEEAGKGARRTFFQSCCLLSDMLTLAPALNPHGRIFTHTGTCDAFTDMRRHSWVHAPPTHLCEHPPTPSS